MKLKKGGGGGGGWEGELTSYRLIFLGGVGSGGGWGGGGGRAVFDLVFVA